MALFHVIEGAQAVTISKGLYRQAKLYHRQGLLYVGHSNGFLKVYRNGGTSKPDVSCPPDAIDLSDADASLAENGTCLSVVFIEEASK